jgi:hypothetical protein
MPDSLISRLLRRIGRTANPLFDPYAEARRSREVATTRALNDLNDRIARLGDRIDHVGARVDKIDRRQVRRLEGAIESLHASTRRQAAFADRLLRRAHPQTQREFVRERVLRRMRAIGRSGRPIVIGPWTGEVGFELLYWVPFVRWAVERFNLDPARIILVSRGGAQSWYGLPGARYVDVLERRSTLELRERMAEAKKQRTVRLFDRRLIREIAAGADGPVDVLHPSWMYALYMPYWKQTAPIRWIDEMTACARIQPPAIEGLYLPADYVALRFYFSDCFPDTPENRALVSSIVTSIARQRDVVLLGSGVMVDEHRDAPHAGGLHPRVHTVDHLMRAENNLAVQTAVIAGASAFVGTYGGFSYLAPLCGVDTVALYSLKNYYEHHLDFAQQMFAEVGGGSLTVVDSAVRGLVGQIAGVDALQ